MASLIPIALLVALVVYLVIGSQRKGKLNKQPRKPMVVQRRSGSPIEIPIAVKTPSMAEPLQVGTLTLTSAVVFDESAPPDAAQEGRLAAAYWAVMSELQGEGITSDLLLELKPKILATLNDPRRCASELVKKLDGLSCNWPRWNSHARRQGYDTAKDVNQLSAEASLESLLNGTLKADLVALGREGGVALKESMTKAAMVKRLLEMSPEHLECWEFEKRESIKDKGLKKVEREMAEALIRRISTVAHEARHLEQMSDPDVVQLHPYWRFICPSDIGPKPPKKCRDMDQKVLPAAEAMKTFPKIPCERLDCQCRFTTQRRVDEHYGIGGQDVDTHYLHTHR
jgi:hypothetical protein